MTKSHSIVIDNYLRVLKVLLLRCTPKRTIDFSQTDCGLKGIWNMHEILQNSIF